MTRNPDRPSRRVIGAAFLLLVAAVWLVSCASGPEAQLKRGYDTVAASARTATVLLQRGAISPDEAQRVLTLGEAAQASLDDGKQRLKDCRAAQAADPAVKCTAATANIALGSSILLELERYLDTREGN